MREEQQNLTAGKRQKLPARRKSCQYKEEEKDNDEKNKTTTKTKRRREQRALPEQYQKKQHPQARSQGPALRLQQDSTEGC